MQLGGAAIDFVLLAQVIGDLVRLKLQLLGIR